jgi:hypothetical protein
LPVVQACQLPAALGPSSRHSKVAPDSSASNEKVALVLVDVPLGPERMVVTAGRVSTAIVRPAEAEEELPAASRAVAV